MIKPIKACLKCGSKNLHARTVSDGLIPGCTDTLGILVCEDCNYQGIPIIFYTSELHLAIYGMLCIPYDATEFRRNS